jgi:hypothetical protein
MVTLRRGILHPILQVMKSVKWSRMSMLSLVSEKGPAGILAKMTCGRSNLFWELPYWEDLDVHHSIDVMHVEKNVCESLLRTLLNTDGETMAVFGYAFLDLDCLQISIFIKSAVWKINCLKN